ncbi:LysR family transcriptional regulator [Sphingomonas paeninsulae]|jgi:DNA-binding transcriptional LysR family regulator|uniref:LysR family transcriptional regulator n=1 Tax=Sphingomonas paeninsulae TaxID=2319844 RepID=A0A494TFG6_SPHPE|nr:LysR family transcriptional regulator [Sphingomonas paeninsulae]AYJ86104.1 LysR family transcriptional regulator [Sphingomonas paeninsulae]
MRLPDLEAWAIFATVVEHRSFSAAAVALGLSKATVSKAITRLETQTGASLFHRTSRRLALTETGTSLAERAARILADAQAIDECARESTTAPAGLVRLAVPMSFGLSHVGPIISRFLTAFPKIDVDLNLSDERVDLVGDGYDAALRIAALPDSSLRARKLRDVETRIVAAPSYLERRGNPRHPADLNQHDCFGYAYFSTPEHWRLVNAKNKEIAVVKPGGRLRTNNADSMLPALFAGHGIAIAPDFIVDAAIANGQVVAILHGWSPPAIALHLVTPPGRLRPRRVEALLDFLTESLTSDSRIPAA